MYSNRVPFSTTMTTLNLSGPVAPAPPGVSPSFSDPPNEAVLAYSTSTLSLICVTFFTWFRFFVKMHIVGTLHVEDYIIPFAWLAAIGQIVPGYMIYEFAPIIHDWDLPLYKFSKYLLYFRLGAIFYNISILLIKIAMLIQVLRVFVPRGSQSKTYYIVHFLIWSTSLYYVINFFAMVFTCNPIHKAWEPWVEGKCLNMSAIAITTGVINLLGDVTILAVCQRVIWKVVKIDRKQRVQLSAVFLAGIAPCVFSVFCLYYNTLQVVDSHDFLHNSALMSLACYGEIASGMFVLFLPVLPRFFSWFKTRPAWTRLTHSSTALESGNVGVTEEKKDRKVRSLWHISYTIRENVTRCWGTHPAKGDQAPRIEQAGKVKGKSGEDFGSMGSMESTVGSECFFSEEIIRTRGTT
ncbi:hypothetical protein CC78DRAFT_616364 [Lojkania enalia]|uniref:Rhodopsin domain-containing protein n=1 Tax=Lojkania enalia TaxID=147567 RepID=A0A9P4KF67_9PLEO|nr:hypothetical protein CC78DRAFT_616364 [Didymosphaeria enalia]